MKSEISAYIVFILFIMLTVVLAFSPTILGIDVAFLEKEVESEIVNGIITASSIIFGFQFVSFRVPRKGKERLFYSFVFLYEALLIGFVGFSYLQNVAINGYLTGGTLILAFTSLITVLLWVILFSFLDFIRDIHSVI